MRNNITRAVVLAASLLSASCSQQKDPSPNTPEYPAPIGFDEDELSKMREKYFELIHTAPPGVDWKKIEAANVERNIRLRKAMKLKKMTVLTETESFANGALKGIWSERGSNNQTGSIIACDYDSIGNNLYVISSGGSLWKSIGLQPNNWTLLNDDHIFDNSMLKVLNKASGGIRIFGTFDNTLSYSDDNGANFSPVTLNFPVAWEGNKVQQMIILKGLSNAIYLLCNIWDDVTWSSKLALYRSVNEGSSFTKFYTFSHDDFSMVKLLNPYNSNLLLLTDCKTTANKIGLSQVTGTTVTLLNNTTQPQAIVSAQVAGMFDGNKIHLYLMNNNKSILNSTNQGLTWNIKGTLPQDSWNRLDVSNEDAAKVYTGGVEAMRSYSSGDTWDVVNNWYDYNSNITGKLHADIMNIVNYRKSDGSSFMIINNHGGVAISYDNLTTTNNLSVTGLHSAQYYDILTAPDSQHVIYGASQDQGLHKNTTANTSGLLNFSQEISGDYGYLTIADSSGTLYAEYPGGNLYVFNNLTGAYLKTWGMPGTQKPNYSWLLPVKNTYNIESDTVLMAGGNLNGGGGSYLCKIAMSKNAGYTTSASQYAYNFRANSSNTTSGISAIESSPLEPERIYVATEDGTFFYTQNSGSSWSKSNTFSLGGGWYLYGATILASRLTKKMVWYGGSGYAGSAVFKSTDGGQTFTPMTNGLPQTLVHEMVTNFDESLLFAATDAGPYVYVVAENQWYPMIGSDNPIQSYTSVEFLLSANTVRFATYGRGIFDFKISEPFVYYFSGNGNWDNPQNWLGGVVPPAVLTGNNKIFINPSGECILNISQTVSNGAKLTVVKNKKLIITGDLNQN